MRTLLALHAASWALAHLGAELLAWAGGPAHPGPPEASPTVGVSLIKPVYRCDEFSEACFRSWLTQDYAGEVQVIFSLQDPDDPALALLARLAEDPALAPFEVMVHPIEPGYHGKTSNLLHGVRGAKHPVLVFSDADIQAPPHALRHLVACLEDGDDLVGCWIAHTHAKDVWARTYAAVWNVATLYLSAPLTRVSRRPLVPGGTVALWAHGLRDLGGIEAIGGQVGEDLALNRLAQRAGWRGGIGPRVTSPVGRLGRAGWADKLSRSTAVWAEFPLYPWFLLGVPLVYGYLWLIPALAWRGDGAGALAGLAFVAARALVTGGIRYRAEGHYRPLPEVVLVEASILAFAGRALVGSDFTWSGVAYRRDERGRLVTDDE